VTLSLPRYQSAMPSFLTDHWEFLKQFRERFETTGAIAPSGRFLARAMTGPMARRERPSRVLEIGPGTGAVTRRIVRLLKPEDRFDLVEVNPTFAAMLRQRFEQDPTYRQAAERSAVHECPIQEFAFDQPYDVIISGLPLNNFPADLVRQIFDTYIKLLAPGGTLSYFEYMYVRPMRRLVAGSDEKARLTELDRIADEYLSRYRIHRSWVFVNVPPAWVQHLRKE
jgi:phosphatidylethanolamine/phosphatidyl-N-methylethanolamine N-methyltransferase